MTFFPGTVLLSFGFFSRFLYYFCNLKNVNIYGFGKGGEKPLLAPGQGRFLEEQESSVVPRFPPPPEPTTLFAFDDFGPTMTPCVFGPRSFRWSAI